MCGWGMFYFLWLRFACFACVWYCSVGGKINGFAKCGVRKYLLTVSLQFKHVYSETIKIHVYTPDFSQWQDLHDSHEWWRVHERTWMCLYNLFREDTVSSVWFQQHWPVENESMWCVWGKGASLSSSLSIFCFTFVPFPHIYQVAPSQTRTSPPCLTPTHLTTRPLSPSHPLPSLHSQCLALKGWKNAKPAQISVIISFTGTGLMSLGGPGFTYTKDRVKRKRKKRSV